MQTVVIGQNSVNPSVDDSIGWIEAKSKSGELNASSSRLAVTALRALAERLLPEESRAAADVLEQLPELCRRWTNLNADLKQDTARTYQQRARWALELFVAWKADPANFKFPNSDRPKVVREEKSKAARAKQDAVPPPQQHEPPARAARGREVTIALGEGRVFRCELPETFVAADVKRIAWTLTGHADDFDTAISPSTQIFPVGG